MQHAAHLRPGRAPLLPSPVAEAVAAGPCGPQLPTTLPAARPHPLIHHAAIVPSWIAEQPGTWVGHTLQATATHSSLVAQSQPCLPPPALSCPLPPFLSLLPRPCPSLVSSPPPLLAVAGCAVGDCPALTCALTPSLTCDFIALACFLTKFMLSGSPGALAARWPQVTRGRGGGNMRAGGVRGEAGGT